jgi:hypothetical protein
MRIGIQLASNNSGKTFIRLSSGARKSVKIRSPALSFVDPKVHMYSRVPLPIQLCEKCDDLDRWHASIGEEFDKVTLFNFHDFDPFCPMDPLLRAKLAERPISTVLLFTHRNRGCIDHLMSRIS